MARITQVNVTYGRKFNLGDYNSAHIEISLWAELDEGDDAEAVTQDLWTQAKEAVKEQALPLHRRLHAEAEQIFAGLPVELREDIINTSTKGKV